MGDDEENIVRLVARTAQREFVKKHAGYYLIGTALARPALGPMKTMGFSEITLEEAEEILVIESENRTALPVRKKQEVFESKITVGRATNNDIVIADATISKLHAWFVIDGDRLLLVDAGSRNGTHLGDTRLAAKTPTPAKVGERIRFGSAELVLQDANGCWEALRRRKTGPAT